MPKLTRHVWTLWVIATYLALSATCSSTEMKDSRLISPSPLVIAHRGASSLAPENTLAAARKALQLGADMWELDVAVTADGELVVIHDDTLDRTCNVKEVFPGRVPWRVWEFSLAEIQSLDCGSWFTSTDPFGQIKAGNISEADAVSYRGEPAPSLRQALEYTHHHHWRVNVELKKQPNQELSRILIKKSVALIEELDMDDGGQVVVSSFEHDYLRRLRALNPRIPVQALTNTSIPDLASYLAQLGTDACNPRADVWSVPELGQMGHNGIRFNVWTVNDESMMRDLIQAGLYGIITDYPQTLIALVDASR